MAFALRLAGAVKREIARSDLVAKFAVIPDSLVLAGEGFCAGYLASNGRRYLFVVSVGCNRK